MPSLQDLLDQTMFGTAVRGARLPLVPVALSKGVFHSPVPKPHPFGTLDLLEHEEAALHNQIWRFSWDPANPGTFTDVKINSRGMGMDYAMAMSALKKVECREVRVKRQGENPLDLYLAPEFLVGAWWSRGGTISGSGLWPLEAIVDVGLVAVFAYELGESGIQPLTKDAVEELGDDLIPPKGNPRFSFLAGEAASAWVCVGPARYVVAVELVLAKERPDFVPGSLVGFARINPHVFVWSNDALEEAHATILLDRPATTTGCGNECMKDQVRALIVTDTNDEHSAESYFDFPIPYTDNLYDYYQVDAYEYLQKKGKSRSDHPAQEKGEVTLADARKRERILSDAVVRQTQGVRNDTDIRKCRRQGQFDNVHLAARMKADFADSAADSTLHDILMINQCLHDCVHMHVRWSEFLDKKGTNMLHGWGPGGPYTKPGAPQVPPNQTVFLSLPTPHTIGYRALATDVGPGEVTVFCHHGCAYAVDQWPGPIAATLVNALLGTIRERALHYEELYLGKFSDPWVEFYWRVRWMRQGNAAVERLTFLMEECIG